MPGSIVFLRQQANPELMVSEQSASIHNPDTSPAPAVQVIQFTAV